MPEVVAIANVSPRARFALFLGAEHLKLPAMLLAERLCLILRKEIQCGASDTLQGICCRCPSYQWILPPAKTDAIKFCPRVVDRNA